MIVHTATIFLKNLVYLVIHALITMYNKTQGCLVGLVYCGVCRGRPFLYWFNAYLNDLIIEGKDESKLYGFTFKMSNRQMPFERLDLTFDF